MIGIFFIGISIGILLTFVFGMFFIRYSLYSAVSHNRDWWWMTDFYEIKIKGVSK